MFVNNVIKQLSFWRENFVRDKYNQLSFGTGLL